MIVTEYDPPRPETLPYDAQVDAQGMVKYGDFGTHVLGMLDPKTGRVVEYLMPPSPDVGLLDLVFDKQGDIWMGTMYQGNLAKFDRDEDVSDPASPTFRDRDEARIAMVMPPITMWTVNVDGGDSEYQVDVKTGEWKAIDYSVGLPKDSLIARQLSPTASRLTRRTTLRDIRTAPTSSRWTQKRRKSRRLQPRHPMQAPVGVTWTRRTACAR